MFGFLRRRTTSKQIRPARRYRLCLKTFEERLLPSTYTVTSTADSGTNTLRWAITNVDNDTSLDTIKFNISGTGAHTISLLSSLPTITNSVIIDGTSQSGYAGSPLIVLNGSSAGSSDGLDITAGGSTVKGLAIDNFSGDGIAIWNGGGNTITANYLGIDSTGTIARRNTISGLLVESANNTIGGTTAGADNVLSGNAQLGIQLYGTSATGNVVQGNLIGTNAAGTGTLPNSDDGILINGGASNNTIGGTVTGAANVVAGNGWTGIVISDASTNGNVVAGNFIGTNANSASTLGNGNYGVFIGNGAASNRIGADGSSAAADAAARNIISGNAWSGVGIFDSGTTGNIVAGNYIGTDVTGETPLVNGNLGVWLGNGAQANRVGTSGAETDNAGERNIISGNNYQGVGIFDLGTNSNIVAGNYIGLDAAGTTALGNGNNGIWIANGAKSNRIGTNGNGVGDAAERNVISGNSYSGVTISDSGTNANMVAGNYIGTNATGSTALPNGQEGVDVYNGAQGNTIGGSTAQANLIMGNTGAGVAITDNTTTGNSVRANSIYGNGGLGIDVGVTGVQVDHVGTTTGPNKLQNYPVLTSAAPGSTTTIGGTLNALPSTTYTLDFYANSTHDLSFYGPGQTYLGSASVTTDANGNATFSVTLAVATTTGQWVTATATDPSGNTSEFSGALALPTAPLTLSTTTWTPVGPSPVAMSYPYTGPVMSGRVDTAVSEPGNNNIMYLVADGGGVWKTTDWLDTSPVWTPLTDGQLSVSTNNAYTALAIAASNPSIMYATVQGPGGGVLKSTDGGTTWALTGNSVFNQSSFSKIVVDPNNANNVFVGVWYGASNTSPGVWRSTNGGTSWTNVTANIHSSSTTVSDAASDIVIDPANSSILYAGLVWDASTGSKAGLYESANGGTTWSQVGGGLPTGSAIGNTIRVVEAPSSPSTLYATVFDSTQTPHRYASINSGSTWMQLPALPTAEETRYWHVVLSVDPSNAQTIYVNGDHTLYRSTNGGNSWIELDSSEDPVGVYFDASGSFVLVGDHGIYRQNSPNYYINKQGNLQDSEFYDITFDPNNPNTLYGIAQDQFSAIKTNGYPVWNATGQAPNNQDGGGTGETGKILVDPTNSAILYRFAPLDADTILLVSTDGGASWTEAGSGVPTTLASYTFAYDSQKAIAEDPSNHNRLVLGTNQVYQSTNGGSSFTAMSPVLSPSSNSEDQFITAVAIAPSAPNTIYAATHDGRLFVTTNGGTSWTEMDTGLPINQFNTFISSIAISPTNANQVFVASGPFPVNEPFGTPHVLMTTNGGTSWSAINGNIPSQLWTNTIAVDWRPATPVLYVGTDQGVYSSANLGTSWAVLGQGLPNSPVSDLELLPSANRLAVSTYGRGAFEITIGTPGQVASLSATPSVTTTTAGVVFTITVKALDGSGNLVPSYQGKVHFTSTDKKAVKPADYTFTAKDAGQHVFKFTLKTAGIQTATVTDTANSSLTVTTANITVNPGAAKTLAITTFPGAPVAGTAYSITITAKDAYANVATGYRGTVHFSVTDTNPFVVLPADYPFVSSDNGVHTFTGAVKLITAGTQTLTVADTVTSTIKGTKKVTVKPAAAASLMVFGFPSTATAGTAYSFTVEAVDKYNNVATTYRGKVHFTSSDTAAGLPLDYTFTSTDAGKHTFSATLNTPGTNESITATDIKNSKITGSEAGISVVSGPIRPMLGDMVPLSTGFRPWFQFEADTWLLPDGRRDS